LPGHAVLFFFRTSGFAGPPRGKSDISPRCFFFFSFFFLMSDLRGFRVARDCFLTREHRHPPHQNPPLSFRFKFCDSLFIRGCANVLVFPMVGFFEQDTKNSARSSRTLLFFLLGFIPPPPISSLVPLAYFVQMFARSFIFHHVRFLCEKYVFEPVLLFPPDESRTASPSTKPLLQYLSVVSSYDFSPWFRLPFSLQ